MEGDAESLGLEKHKNALVRDTSGLGISAIVHIAKVYGPESLIQLYNFMIQSFRTITPEGT